MLLREENQVADDEDQPISYVNVDLNLSSPKELPSFNSTASEGLPSLVPSLAFNEPVQLDPALLPSKQITAPPEHSVSGQDDKPADGDWFWTCHVCNEGPWFWDLAEACQHCGHVRCASCTYEEK